MIERNFITPEIKADLDRINEDCIRMHVPPPPVLFVQCEVSDIETGEVELIQEEKASSFLRNYHNIICVQGLCGVVDSDTTYGAGHLNFKQDGGAIKSFGKDYYTKMEALWETGANNNDYGPVIGTSDAAWSFEQYRLDAIIAHGTGAGQMSYTDQPTHTMSYDTGTKKWSHAIARVINNLSGSEITIKEAGIKAGVSANNQFGSGLIERSVLASPVAVANNKKITVTYTLEMTFPA